jgi:hypothetical protein
MKWIPSSRPGNVNYAMFDYFTLVHFVIGCTYGWLGSSLITAIVLAVLWEVFENPLKMMFPQVFPHATADTLKNSLGDIMAVVAGWYVIYLSGVQ